MAVVVTAPPALAGELSLYHTTDPLLANSPVLVFYGPAASLGATTSRIQVHIFTPAGCGSYSRLAISPTSPYWSAVNNLPREEQGDEVCRALAFGLKKYFVELPENVKEAWAAQAKAPAPAALFGDNHIAVLATRVTKIENVRQVTAEIKRTFCEQTLSWLDVDVVLPPGSIKEPRARPDSANADDLDSLELLRQRYGQYADLIAGLGEPTFLPTSKLRRAPSKATTIGRSASFLRQQKEGVRKELKELLDTETNYVARIRELFELSQTLGADLSMLKKSHLRSVFPAGLEEIVQLNTSFLETLRLIIHSTEKEALTEIDTTPEQPVPTQKREDFKKDAQGVVAVADYFCDQLPGFADGYSTYVAAHPACAQNLRDFLKNDDSTLAALLSDVGEQRMTSLLIEPVQRLPRYSLYIDSIAKQLPLGHPALRKLMKARDIVSDICSQSGHAGNREVDSVLTARVRDWPSRSQPLGRLVSAVDVVELLEPHDLETCRGCEAVFLLFTDSLVILEKTGSTAVNARALLTELESGTFAMRPTDNRPSTPGGLKFLRRLQLDAVQCSESHNGSTVQLMAHSELSNGSKSAQAPTFDTCQTWYLENPYQNKAPRFVEELSRTRIEHRFSEVERESSKWEVYATSDATDVVGLNSAVFEDSNAMFVSQRRSFASSRIVVDLDRHSNRPRSGRQGIHNVIAVSPVQAGLWRLSVDSVNGASGREHIATPNLLPTIRKKLSVLTANQYGMTNSAALACLLIKNETALRSLDLHTLLEADGIAEMRPVPVPRQPRSKSPVKMLSGLLSSGGPDGRPVSSVGKSLVDAPSLGHTPRLPTSSSHASKPSSREGLPGSRDYSTPLEMSFTTCSENGSLGMVKKLEETMSTFVLALQARKGNIVGKSLKNRHSAEECQINDLYNALLEDPNMMVLAAQASVDTLFAAFEKFINVAWAEQFGRIVAVEVLQDIQAKAETMFPAHFDDFARKTLFGLPAQNQRALKTIMQLLADLLDGTGNDGDRGILTAAFTEVLVPEGNPHDYIALIDRFVDDTDTYFGEPLDEGQRAAEGSVFGHKRSRSAHTGSLTSNHTSSIRRKFGLSRDNSKSEHDSRMGLVWRTLSKSKGDASPSSNHSRSPFSTIHRSQSTDSNLLLKRPSSQDGSSLLKPSALDEPTSSSVAAQPLGLSTIGEHPSFIPSGPPKKKRRSSLGDLQSVLREQAAAIPAPPRTLFSPPAERRTPFFHKVLDEKSLPAAPSTPSSKNSSGRFGSAVKDTPRSRLPASFRGDSSSAALQTPSSSPQRPKTAGAALEENANTVRPTSNIPHLRPRQEKGHVFGPAPREGLSERIDAGNATRKSLPSPEKNHKLSKSAAVPANSPSPKKLRMQSPQKLRERLQNEQSSITAAQGSLRDELNKIGEELTAAPSRMGSVRAAGVSTVRTRPSTQASNIDLAARVLKIEGQLPKQFEEVTARINSIQTDLSSSLAVSETKCRRLDGLYREANAENEALYKRFNDELNRILKAVRDGEGVGELRAKLHESQDEAAKLKREISRLKRENAGLRAQLKE